MPNRIPSSENPLRLPSLDEIVEAFEIVWNREGSARIEDFLPDSYHPDYERIVLELLCVDLERRWKTDRRRTVDAYCRQFPVLLADRRLLERLAFEEYRCLRENGESADREDYARRYALRTDHWPDSSAAPPPGEMSGPYDDESGVGHEVTPQMEFPDVGDRFLEFEIVERLGESKFGRVYLATQANLASRWVVIKVATDVWSESERLTRLQHTNVVPVYSVHQSGGLQAVCMPYLGRQTLADLLPKITDRSRFTASDLLRLTTPHDNEATGTLDRAIHSPLRQLQSLDFERLCAWVVSQIAAGLAHAHDRGILHRDLKPANILLTCEGQPMILDFNLSDEIVAGGRASVLVGGTLPYMAPEHLKAVFSDGHIDVRSDVYSLGVILFQLLTGHLPFPTPDGSIVAHLDLMIKERETKTLSASEYKSRVSPALQAILRHCLAPDPRQRYQSADQLREDLQRHLQDYPLRHAPDRSAVERIGKWSRRHPRCTSFGAVATVASVVVAILASLFILRGQQLEQLGAIDRYRQFESLVWQTRAPLSLPLADEESLHPSWRMLEQALDLYHIESPEWRQRTAYRALDRPRQIALENSLQELLFLAANSYCRRARGAWDEHEQQRQLQLALRYNQASRELRPTPPPRALLRQAAEIARLLGRDEDSARWLQLARRLPADDAPHHFLDAVQLVCERRHAEAVPTLYALADETPDSFFAWFLLGVCHCNSGNLDEADSCFTRCAALWPESHLAYFQRGVLRLHRRRFARAERDFTLALERYPNQTTSLLNRALARIELQRLSEAIDDLTLAMERGRDDSLIFLLRSRAWAQRGDPKRAAGDLQEALRRTPVSVDGWIGRGLARRSTDPEGALADLESALDQDPQSRKALLNKAHVLAELLDRPMEAIAALDRLLEWNPRDVSALAGRAVLRARLGDRDLAVEDAQAAVQAGPDARTFYRVATVFARTSQTAPADAAEAVRLLGEATKREIRWATMATKDPDMKPLVDRADFRSLVGAAAVLQQIDTTLLISK